jgi:hypothetical protein
MSNGRVTPRHKLVEAQLSESSTLLVVTTSFETVTDLVVQATRMDEDDRPEEIRLLTDSDTLRALDRDFIVASNARDLMLDGRLEARSFAAEGAPTLFVSSAGVTSCIPLGGGDVAAVDVDNEEFLDRVTRRYDTAWDDAMPHAVQTPPYSRLISMVGETLGPDVEADISTALESMAETRAPGDRLDPVTVGLLVGASHELEFSDLVEWGEDSGLASRAKFSRTKQRLEEAEIVDTDSVNIGVGRPRQRLVLADEALAELSPEELIATAQSVLTDGAA